ncbi:DUF4382 domain-containing protein [Aquiflexum sp. TKW24L]|uniref:DUF4382 domain-containing protein n=1 Tax=Aquiflexum sp. TKW24L TaxID=2942212 RepID=UPI0020BE2879|nr:DUF4382 domain-containing protein [Aquiflexum sp. TKW24L]MCL6258663.1 DUF4382 domain-containing protein [Aquiflexum sp. TKW24L]
MKIKIKSLASITLFSLFVTSIVFSSCDNENRMDGEGSVSLNITDAPIDQEGVTGVYITFTGIEYQSNGDSWNLVEDFEGPVTINLLELQNGKTSLLGNFNAGAGNYTGLRFLLDAAEMSNSPIGNSGCYITFSDGSEVPLFVPSGAKTGYKAVGNFTVPLNGEVEVTADFNLRKSVVEAGMSGKYLLKPTIRIVVNNEAGEIKGSLINPGTELDYVVYIYEKGTYNDTESALQPDQSPSFPNAISNTMVDANNKYILAFLAPGAYELIVVSVNEGGDAEVVLGPTEEVVVESRKATLLDLEIK